MSFYRENIIMRLVHLGKSRQEAHEHIRVLSHQAAKTVKVQGQDNDLIDRIRKDEFFAPIIDQLDELMSPETFVGRAPQQVQKFLAEDGEVILALRPYQNALEKLKTVELNV